MEEESFTSCFFCEKIIPLEEVNYAWFRYKGQEDVFRENCCDDCMLENSGGGRA